MGKFMKHSMSNINQVLRGAKRSLKTTLQRMNTYGRKFVKYIKRRKSPDSRKNSLDNLMMEM